MEATQSRVLLNSDGSQSRVWAGRPCHEKPLLGLCTGLKGGMSGRGNGVERGQLGKPRSRQLLQQARQEATESDARAGMERMGEKNVKRSGSGIKRTELQSSLLATSSWVHDCPQIGRAHV